tara:strand:+ start:92 stop:520 length:429 start_codon:yes stop_codon:yes gene_type:complete
MATTTATISINSDIMSYPISINTTMTMKKLQSCTGLEETTGLRTKKFTAVTETVVIEEDEFTNTKASKVYMRNTSSDKAHYFYVAKHASEAAADTKSDDSGETIGRLHGGDWMLIPYLGDVNITVASSSTDAVILEYMVFAE